MASIARALIDERSVPRDEVHYRTRAVAADGRSIPVLIVNISACGLMMRCETDHAVGERLKVALPVVGTVNADVRWSLGGRTGCELDAMIALAPYYELLTAMVKGR